MGQVEPAGEVFSWIPDANVGWWEFFLQGRVNPAACSPKSIPHVAWREASLLKPDVHRLRCHSLFDLLPNLTHSNDNYLLCSITLNCQSASATRHTPSLINRMTNGHVTFFQIAKKAFFPSTVLWILTPTDAQHALASWKTPGAKNGMHFTFSFI